MVEIHIGTRKLQKGAGAHVINVPVVAVRTLDLHTGDTMRWSITADGALRMEKNIIAPADDAPEELER